MDWISVKERLPERMSIINEITNHYVEFPFSERVLVWTNVGAVTAQYNHDLEYWLVSPSILKNILRDGSIVITDWCTLPEPGGEGGE